MAAKPVRLMPFATSATGLLRRVPMSGSLEDDGYDTDDVPTAGNFSDRFGLLGEWIDYLNEIFEEPVDINSTLSVDNLASFFEGMIVNGDILLDNTLPFGEIRHNYLKTQTVALPAWISSNAAYSPSNKYVTTTGAAQAVYAFHIDGGMRPTTVSVEVAKISGSPGTTTATAVLIDNGGTEVTESANMGSYATAPSFNWLDVNVIGDPGWPVPIGRAGQDTLTLWLELPGANVAIRRAVMFYDRPVP